MDQRVSGQPWLTMPSVASILQGKLRAEHAWAGSLALPWLSPGFLFHGISVTVPGPLSPCPCFSGEDYSLVLLQPQLPAPVVGL